MKDLSGRATMAAILLASSAPAAALLAIPAAAQPSSISSDALHAAVSDQAVRDFYDAAGWSAVWSSSAASSLRQALDDRNRHGLDRVHFLEQPGSRADPAAQEVAQTKAALRYASALAHGAVDPASLHDIYTVPRPDSALAQPLLQAIRDGKLADWFNSLAPQDNSYARLSEAYRDYAKTAGGGSSADIPTSGLIKVGDTDQRVSAIAGQLREAEYLDGGETDAPRYTQRMADAVTRLQTDYGIAADGVIGPQTLQVLNMRPDDRARALAVALERQRWLTRSPPATRIDVNTAAARLDYFRDGQLVDSRKVVVGKSGNETPLLMSPIYRLVANPTWTVPKSIENGELANVSQSYLRSRNMERKDGWIVQQPGPDNALGLVKFDMRNDHAIYLHDTSSPELFTKSERHLSHGCVRVEDAQGFARMLARDAGIEAQWREATGADDPQFVDLPQPIPVRLLYRNVFLDDGGNVAFRTDPYGWNAPIARSLGFTGGSTAKARSVETDIGP